MTDHDEIDRLARANPAPPGSLAGAARSGAGLAARESIMRALTPARPRRARRLIGPLVGALGALALVALIAALIVATPSGDPDGPAGFDGTLRVSLLDRPQTEDDLIRSGGWTAYSPSLDSLDPASIRLVERRDDVSVYVAGVVGRAGPACILQTGPASRGFTSSCDDGDPIVERGILAHLTPEDGGLTRIVGVVPDGISSVGVADATAVVRDNVFSLSVAGPIPEHAVLEGPAAVAIPPIASVVLFTRTDALPVVAARLLPEPPPPPRAPGAPPPPPEDPLIYGGTLEDAVAAMPFTVFVADPAPLSGEQLISYSRDHPDLFPQVTISYLPETTGPHIILLQGAARGKPGAQGPERTIDRGARKVYVSGEGDPSGQIQVRVVIDGTNIQINGAPLPELLKVADSLRPAPR